MKSTIIAFKEKKNKRNRLQKWKTILRIVIEDDICRIRTYLYVNFKNQLCFLEFQLRLGYAKQEGIYKFSTIFFKHRTFEFTKKRVMEVELNTLSKRNYLCRNSIQHNDAKLCTVIEINSVPYENIKHAQEPRASVQKLMTHTSVTFKAGRSTN